MARETSNLNVATALPPGYVRPATQGEWRVHMREVLDAQPIRADRRETVEAIALVVMYEADWDTLASRPTWAGLEERCQQMTGRGSRSTVARHLAYLIDLNLIARAAHGRRGCHAPGGCQATVNHWRNARPCSTPGECPPDEAAVYILCIPSPIHAVNDDPTHQTPATEDPTATPVDELETPPELCSEGSLPVRAKRQNPEYEPLRGTAFFQAAQAPQPAPRGNRTLIPWSSHATTSSPEDRLRAAAELQSRLPVLRQISTRDLRYCLREFFFAGWTVADIAHALDRRPDDTRWPHSGATGIGPAAVRGWIAHRLAPWTSGGTPRRSFSQRGAAELIERRAREQAERERHAAERAHAVPIPADVRALADALRRPQPTTRPVAHPPVDPLPQARERLAHDHQARVRAWLDAAERTASAADEARTQLDDAQRRERDAAYARARARAERTAEQRQVNAHFRTY